MTSQRRAHAFNTKTNKKTDEGSSATLKKLQEHLVSTLYFLLVRTISHILHMPGIQVS